MICVEYIVVLFSDKLKEIYICGLYCFCEIVKELLVEVGFDLNVIYEEVFGLLFVKWVEGELVIIIFGKSVLEIISNVLGMLFEMVEGVGFFLIVGCCMGICYICKCKKNLG